MGFEKTLIPLAAVILAAAPSRLPAQDEDLSGTAVLSDGRVIKGEIEMDAPGYFSLFDPSRKRRLRVPPSKVARLLFKVESEELLRGWMFQEESRNTKIKLPFLRPVRQLAVTLVLKTGQRITGHLDTAVLHLWAEEGENEKEYRLVLTSRQRGKKGQKLKDLLWVKELVLGDAPPLTRPAVLSLSLPPGVQARAVSLEDHVSYAPAEPRKKKRKKGGKKGKGVARSIPGETLFEGVLPGKVDLYFLGGDTLWAGWPAGAGPLPAETLRQVRNKIEDVEEFFDEKKVLLARALPGKRALALVQGRRLGVTTYKNRKVARWDLYLLKEVDQGTWDIQLRFFLFRRVGKKPGVPVPGVKKVVPVPRYGGIQVPAGGGRVDLGKVEFP